MCEITARLERAIDQLGGDIQEIARRTGRSESQLNTLVRSYRSDLYPELVDFAGDAGISFDFLLTGDCPILRHERKA